MDSKAEAVVEKVQGWGTSAEEIEDDKDKELGKLQNQEEKKQEGPLLEASLSGEGAQQTILTEEKEKAEGTEGEGK